jgi:hypothetical protein
MHFVHSFHSIPSFLLYCCHDPDIFITDNIMEKLWLVLNLINIFKCLNPPRGGPLPSYRI